MIMETMNCLTGSKERSAFVSIAAEIFQSISRYEKGLQNPTFETVKEFAAIFNVSMDYLAGMEKHSNISTFGMNPEQIAITKNLIEAFRKKNISTFQKMSAEHYQIIGKIAVELSKDK